MTQGISETLNEIANIEQKYGLSGVRIASIDEFSDNPNVIVARGADIRTDDIADVVLACLQQAAEDHEAHKHDDCAEDCEIEDTLDFPNP